MNFLFRFRNRMQDKVHGLEGRIQESRSPIKRAFLAIFLMVSYIGLAISYSASLLISNPQKSFSFINNFNPEKGYTVSYSQHRARQRNVKVGAVSSIIVIILVNIINGVLISKERSFASDSKIAAVSVSINNTDPDVNAEYVISLTTSDTIASDTLLHMYFTDAEGTYDNTVTPFASATVSDDMSTVPSPMLAPPIEGDTDGQITAVRIGGEMSAGDYTVVLNNVHNPPEGGEFRYAVSSVAADDVGLATLSNTFDIGAANDVGGGDNGGGDGDGDNNSGDNDSNNDTDSGDDSNNDSPAFSNDSPESNTGVIITPVGTDLLVEWNTIDGAESYSVVYQSGSDSSTLQEINSITDTQYTIEGLLASQTYIIQVFAQVSGQEIVLSNQSEVTTEAKP